MKWIKSSFIFSFFTFISRILGFLRDMLIARYLGTGPIADAFFVAFKAPNLFRRLFAEGALSAAFIPSVVAAKKQSGDEYAKRFAGQILLLLVTSLLIMSLVIEIFMPEFILILAPGFEGQSVRLESAIDLGRICFPYLIFMAIVALLSAQLNTINKFAVAAAAPILLNVFLVLSLFVLTPFVPHYGWALAWGVVAAGIGQALWLTWSAKKNGVMPTIGFPWQVKRIYRFIKLFFPSFLSASITQINIFVGTVFASFFPSAVSYLYYADRLNQLPIAMIGIAVGTVLLPSLSQFNHTDPEAGKQLQKQALLFGFLLSIPAMIGCIILGEQIISILFEYGVFNAEDRQSTAIVLAMYAIGVPAFVSLKILLPCYFAAKDTKTPLYIACFALFLNIALIPVLIRYYSFYGIALATSLSGWFQFTFLLLGLLKRELIKFNLGDLKLYSKILFANIVVIGASYLFSYEIWPLMGSKLEKVVSLPLFITLIIILYFGTLYLLKLKNAFTSVKNA